jgi:hypothetical protein
MGLKHAFTSSKPDGDDATQVRPSNWNEDHVIHTALDFPSITENSNNAPEGHASLYMKRLGENGSVLASKTQHGTERFYSEHEGFKTKVSWTTAGAGLTTDSTYGMQAPTRSAISITAPAISSGAPFARVKGIELTSASGVISWYGVTNAQIFLPGNGTGGGGYKAFFRFAFRDNVTSANAFVGLSSSTVAPTNVDPSTLTNSIGLAKLTGDSTQLYIVSAGTVPITPIPLGSANFPASNSHLYTLVLESDPFVADAVSWYVRNMATGAEARGVISGATFVPASNVFAIWRVWRASSGSQINLLISNFHMEGY